MAISLMYCGLFPLGAVLMLVTALTAPAGLASGPDVTNAMRTGRVIPSYFEPNQGQAGSSVLFLSRGPDSAVLLMAGGRALFRLPMGRLQLTPAGVESRRRATGIDPLGGTVNILVGNDRSKWRTNLTMYSAVKFEQIYRGIDLVYRAGNGELEYDFIVSPGADPAAISLDFSGPRRIELDADDNLLFSLPRGTIQHRKPSVYQQVGPTRREVSGRYLLAGGNRVRFQIGAYDRTLPPHHRSGCFLLNVPRR